MKKMVSDRDGTVVLDDKDCNPQAVRALAETDELKMRIFSPLSSGEDAVTPRTTQLMQGKAIRWQQLGLLGPACRKAAATEVTTWLARGWTAEEVLRFASKVLAPAIKWVKDAAREAMRGTDAATENSSQLGIVRLQLEAVAPL